MNETKCYVYVPFHPDLGFDWKLLTIEYIETLTMLKLEWKWYQILVDGDKKEELK